MVYERPSKTCGKMKLKYVYFGEKILNTYTKGIFWKHKWNVYYLKN